MSRNEIDSKIENIVYCNDLTDEYLDFIYKAQIVGWDIETSGLDWRNDNIGICQLYVPENPVAIVKIKSVPKLLKSLLRDSTVKKVFHHAMFDLRFMAYKWQVSPMNIACTKIAAKILTPYEKQNHSLQELLKEYLRVSIEKKERLSNWFADSLTDEQIHYAINDVRYLIQLLNILEMKLQEVGRLGLAHESFKYIPTRIQLDFLGCEDIFRY